MQDEGNRERVSSVGRWTKLPVSLYPSRGGAGQHGRPGRLRVDDVPGLNCYRHVHIARNVHLKGCRRIGRAWAPKQQARTRTASSGSVRYAGQTAFGQARICRRPGARSTRGIDGRLRVEVSGRCRIRLRRMLWRGRSTRRRRGRRLRDLELRRLIEWGWRRLGFGRRGRLRFRWRGFFRRVRIAELFEIIRIESGQLDRILFLRGWFREFEPPTAIGANPIDDQREDEEDNERCTFPRSKGSL